MATPQQTPIGIDEAPACKPETIRSLLARTRAERGSHSGPTAPVVAALVVSQGREIERILTACATSGLDLSVRPYVGRRGLAEEAMALGIRGASGLLDLVDEHTRSWGWLVRAYGSQVARAACETVRRSLSAAD